MTPIEFRRFVVELIERPRSSTPDLETYLRSLLALVLASRHEPVTLELEQSPGFESSNFVLDEVSYLRAAIHQGTPVTPKP